MKSLRSIATSLRQSLDSHMYEILSKGALAVLIKIIGACITFLFHLLLARLLGAEGSGLYFLALAIITLSAVVGRLGMDNSVTRYVAAHAIAEEWQSVRGVVRHALWLSLAMSTILAVTTFILATPLSKYIFSEPNLAEPLTLMSLAIVPLACITILARALQGLKNVRDSMLIQGVLIHAFATALTFLLAYSYGVNGAVLAYVAATFLTMGYGALIWYLCTRKHGQVRPQFALTTLLSSSFPLLGATLIHQLNLALPVLLLGFWSSSVEVGQYSAAHRTAALISLLLVAANSIIAPKIAAIYRQGNTYALEHIVRHSAMILTIISAPAMLLFMTIPDKIMSLFGPEFTSAWAILVILTIGQIINVVTGPVGFLLTMTGRERSYLEANFIALLISAAGCSILIPLYGGTGAAVASAAALSIVNLVRVNFIRKEIGIIALPWPIKKDRTPQEIID
ncbi:MAG: oligosaccharide flippase family protein [Methylacidiphilales bacterium]|nr:oligosaccharide flippase family protein [Candidatus Methylacidiphilales bacterium]